MVWTNQNKLSFRHSPYSPCQQQDRDGIVSLGMRQFCSSPSPTRVVLMSQSSNIFTNLALEDWLYQFRKFDQQELLLLWRNDPCVVVGRHQNPWTEANVPYLRRTGVKLARRNSGGGTVFHDRGNINCSFFTSRADYKRLRNLQLICAALEKSVRVDVSVNDRDDIVLDNEHKISGTAAKLGRETAYHHCTVLVNVDTTSLHEALNHAIDIGHVESKATKSVKAPVKNLAAKNVNVDIDSVQVDIAKEFVKSERVDIVKVDPKEETFPGIGSMAESLESWNWVFGKTPQFSLKKSFIVPDEILGSVFSADPPFVEYELVLKSGKITSVKCTQSPGLMDPDLDIDRGFLEGRLFDSCLTENIQKADLPERKKCFIIDCIKNIVIDIL